MTNEQRRQNELFASAYHEAGHAVTLLTAIPPFKTARLKISRLIMSDSIEQRIQNIRNELVNQRRHLWQNIVRLEQLDAGDSGLGCIEETEIKEIEANG